VGKILLAFTFFVVASMLAIRELRSIPPSSGVDGNTNVNANGTGARR
jgi:hypothetical protein